MCVKPSLIPSPSGCLRTTLRSHAESRNVQHDELSAFSLKDVIQSFNDLKTNIESYNFNGVDILFNTKTDNQVLIQSLEFFYNTGVLLFNLKINNNFQYEAFHCGVKCIMKHSRRTELPY